MHSLGMGSSEFSPMIVLFNSAGNSVTQAGAAGQAATTLSYTANQSDRYTVQFRPALDNGVITGTGNYIWSIHLP